MTLIGRRQIIPVLLPFPVWRKMLVDDEREEWHPDRFAVREIPREDDGFSGYMTRQP